ncbi:MAG: Crp/Fnr family transcriptional regulator [Spirochaetaceae bacterium]|nr:MAG: Crp/Fnr family transcriptional regulator [Spirochaetaceae bacterium]
MDDLFPRLSEQWRNRLTETSHDQTVPAGSLLFLEEQPGSHLYLLRTGLIRLFRTTPDGREVTIHLVEPGQLFAEIVLFERDTYPVSAIAVEESCVTAIPRERVHQLLDDRSFRSEFMSDLVGKMRFLSQQLYVLTTMDVRGRLIRFLEVRYGRTPKIISELSKTETAAAISVRPETLSRALARLESQGVLTWNGNDITVADHAWTDDDQS